jgi:hypothetical protein
VPMVPNRKDLGMTGWIRRAEELGRRLG